MEIREAQRAEYLGSEAFEWREVFRALQDPKVYMSYVKIVLPCKRDTNHTQSLNPIFPRHHYVRVHYLPSLNIAA